MWEYCGRGPYQTGLRKALERIRRSARSLARIKVPGTGEEFNQSLEKANRIVDYLELAELVCSTRSARHRPLPGRPGPRLARGVLLGPARRRRGPRRRHLGPGPGTAPRPARDTG
ncbi:hypothetical protein SFUMM280S_00409 [Streptomyces fumanus]